MPNFIGETVDHEKRDLPFDSGMSGTLASAIPTQRLAQCACSALPQVSFADQSEYASPGWFYINPVNILSKELLKCAKKAAVPNQGDIKSLETVVALVEVSLVLVTVCTW